MIAPCVIYKMYLTKFPHILLWTPLQPRTSPRWRQHRQESLPQTKIFTVQATHNSQNDRVLSRKKEDIPVQLRTLFRRQKPPSVMVWAEVTSDGKKAPIIFVEEGVKIDQAVYLHLLSEEVVPWVQREYPTALFLFQQDEAPSHTSKLVQSFCTDMFADFWSKDLWPPSSPDLNPMDFGI
eukprot:TRINITY_DN4292_c0_g1_i1.p1 TRINITY_DN4292_c0_g1~~TRINITY_DN4292_c0_g1_i1.p1  ORF type:complete len:180 (-),score=16.23 TRINITY_DN4292_c0_g1_i1:127-666(-)